MRSHTIRVSLTASQVYLALIKARELMALDKNFQLTRFRLENVITLRTGYAFQLTPHEY